MRDISHVSDTYLAVALRIIEGRAPAWPRILFAVPPPNVAPHRPYLIVQEQDVPRNILFEMEARAASQRHSPELVARYYRIGEERCIVYPYVRWPSLVGLPRIRTLTERYVFAVRRGSQLRFRDGAPHWGKTVLLANENLDALLEHAREVSVRQQ